jgi:DNA-binding MarR family transcriptional regulator
MRRPPHDQPATELALALRLLSRRLQSLPCAPACDLSWTQVAVVKRLEEGPATTAELARAEGMKPQSMGTAVASLEAMGLVRRRPHPTDRRQVHLELTSKGRAQYESAFEAKRSWLAQAIARLDPAEQRQLAAAAALLRRLAEV